VIGTLGSDCRFDDPSLLSSVTVWARSGIDGIESGERRELSSAYDYAADMTPGFFRGRRYDGVMRGLRGRHCALVARTRVGPDCAIRLKREDSDERRFAAA
jgi:hypothetical protein